PVEPARRQEVVGREERREAELLRVPGESSQPVRPRARQKERREEDADLHASAGSSSPAATSASRRRSPHSSETARSGSRTVARSSTPCATSASFVRAR